MRVNLIEPHHLTDEHLIAEINEINMISGAFNRSAFSKKGIIFDKIPKKYTLGTGHVYFFYNKAKYLQSRYNLLKKEAIEREIDITLPWKDTFSLIDEGKLGFSLWEDYWPTPESINLITNRICEKITLKPEFYNYTYEKKVYKINAENYCRFLKMNYQLSNSNYINYVSYFLEGYAK